MHTEPSRRQDRTLAAGLLVGALLGATLTRMLTNASEGEPLPTGTPTAHREPETTARPGPDVFSHRTDDPTPTSTQPEAERDLVTSAEAPTDLHALLRGFVAAELRRGWRELRTDEIPADLLAELLDGIMHNLLATPLALGRGAAVKQNTRDAARAALAGRDSIELLRNIDGAEPECADLVASPRFVECFTARSAGVPVDGPKFEPGAALPVGAVLRYPAGVFDVADLSRGNEPFPSDVTVRGAGMDATLLYLEAQGMQSALQRFAVEDCTVYSVHAFTHFRGAPVVLSLRRVRVIGFECGAGGNSVFRVARGMALHATDCRFQGGFGKAQTRFGQLMQPIDPCLARFERCVFERMHLEIARKPTIQFVDCTMHELLDPAPLGPLYENCVVTVCDATQRFDDSHLRRELDELFPQWRGQLTRR